MQRNRMKCLVKEMAAFLHYKFFLLQSSFRHFTYHHLSTSILFMNCSETILLTFIFLIIFQNFDWNKNDQNECTFYK